MITRNPITAASGTREFTTTSETLVNGMACRIVKTNQAAPPSAPPNSAPAAGSTSQALPTTPSPPLASAALADTHRHRAIERPYHFRSNGLHRANGWFWKLSRRSPTEKECPAHSGRRRRPRHFQKRCARGSGLCASSSWAAFPSAIGWSLLARLSVLIRRD